MSMKTLKLDFINAKSYIIGLIHVFSEPGQVHWAYVVAVIDYNISLFRTASRSNYSIIDYLDTIT